jgi:hypothetical protein
MMQTRAIFYLAFTIPQATNPFSIPHATNEFPQSCADQTDSKTPMHCQKKKTLPK